MTNQSNFLLFLALSSSLLLTSLAATRVEGRNNREELSRKRLPPTEIHLREVRNENNVIALLQSDHEAIFDLYFGRAAIENESSSLSKHEYPSELSMSMSYEYSMSMSMSMSYNSYEEFSFSLSFSVENSLSPSTRSSSSPPTQSFTNVPTAMLTNVLRETPTFSSSPSQNSNILTFSNDPSEEQVMITNTTDLSRSDPNNAPTTSLSSPQAMPTAIIPMMGGLVALLFMFGLASRRFENFNGTNPLEYQDIGGDAHSEFSATHGSLMTNVPLEP